MERTMRRKDREITDLAKLEEIIAHCTCCRVGFYDEGEIYIVPLSFGYEITDGAYVLYFHGAGEGRKMDLIAKSPCVGFEMDTKQELIRADVACGHSTRYQSVIGNGIISLVTEPDEKRHGLTQIMNHTVEKKDWAFDEKRVEAVSVFKLQVTKMSGKERA